MIINTILQSFENYLPITVKAIVAVEQTVKAEAAGAGKKQVVLDVVQTIAKMAENVPQPTIAALGVLTDVVVGAFNSAGFFQHGAGSVAPSPAVGATVTVAGSDAVSIPAPAPAA